MKVMGTDNAMHFGQKHPAASALAGGRVTVTGKSVRRRQRGRWRYGELFRWKDAVTCLLVAAVSLAVAAAFHRLAPGFGIVFKPLLWPLVVLPFAVRPRYALVTSFAVPLLSCALTGMPTLPVALTLSCGAAVVTTALALGMAVIRHNRLAHNRDAVVLTACRGGCSSVNCTETSSSSTMAHFAEMRPREWRHD